MNTQITKETLKFLCRNYNSDVLQRNDPYESIVAFKKQKEKLYLISCIECQGEDQAYHLVLYGPAGWEITDEFLKGRNWNSLWEICGFHAGDEYLELISDKDPLDSLTMYLENSYGAARCRYYMTDEKVLDKQYIFDHSESDGAPEVFICYFLPALQKPVERRYAIQVREILQSTIITRAKNEEEAIARVERAIETGEVWFSSIDDFDEREIKLSDHWVQGIVPENEDVSYFTQI